MQMHDYITKYNSLASEEALFNIPFRKEYLLKQIGKGKRVLDIGCLGGQISRLIMDLGNDVQAVEINPVAIEAARKRGVDVVAANVENGLSFNDASFDVVNAGEIVEHLYDTKSFFHECWRVLRPNGIFLFTTPNLNSLENRLRILSGNYLSMVGAYPEDHFGEHVRIFNVSKIRELCEQTGFDVREIRGVPTLHVKRKLSKLSLAFAGRVAPTFSKLLIVKAGKRNL